MGRSLSCTVTADHYATAERYTTMLRAHVVSWWGLFNASRSIMLLLLWASASCCARTILRMLEASSHSAVTVLGNSHVLIIDQPKAVAVQHSSSAEKCNVQPISV